MSDRDELSGKQLLAAILEELKQIRHLLEA